MLPSQVINPRISSQREMIARKEGKFHPISMTSNNVIPYEVGQRIWIQHPASKKWNSGSIKEKTIEPNSYWVELNGADYRRNTNFIKPRQTHDVEPSSRASTEVHFSTSEVSASGPATIHTSSSGCHFHRTHSNHYHKWQEDLYHNTSEAVWYPCKSFF